MATSGSWKSQAVCLRASARTIRGGGQARRVGLPPGSKGRGEYPAVGISLTIRGEHHCGTCRRPGDKSPCGKSRFDPEESRYDDRRARRGPSPADLATEADGLVGAAPAPRRGRIRLAGGRRYRPRSGRYAWRAGRVVHRAWQRPRPRLDLLSRRRLLLGVHPKSSPDGDRGRPCRRPAHIGSRLPARTRASLPGRARRRADGMAFRARPGLARPQHRRRRRQCRRRLERRVAQPAARSPARSCPVAPGWYRPGPTSRCPAPP